MSIENTLENLVRIGFVTDVDRKNRLARVKFQDTGIISDWLPVLNTAPSVPDDQTQPSKGGHGLPSYQRHTHEVQLTSWMPKVNDQVLTLFLPVFGGDGFILGEIVKWK